MTQHIGRAASVSADLPVSARRARGLAVQARERGQGGDAACAKLMRSLVRLAATQIMERFEGVLLDVVAAWLEQHGRRVAISGEHSGETAAVRRAAERWRAKALPDAGEAPPPVNVRWVWGALHAMLSRAHVVEAPANAELALRASAVLVKGRLVAAESGAVVAAPCVLVWPEFTSPGEAKEAAEVKVHAGVAFLPPALMSAPTAVL